jgi:hypothetical protein
MMLFNAIMAMPHAHAPDETAEERIERFHVIAESNAKAALALANGKGWSAWELGLAVTVLQGRESGGFDRRIHAGEEHPVWTQDHGLARCMGQIHATVESGPVPLEVWNRLAGLDVDSTELCARVTAQLLVSYARQCGVYLGHRANRNIVAQAFAGYGSGGKCTPSDEMWGRADQWVALSAKYGPKPDVPGYKRLPTSHLPDEVKECARVMISMLQQQDKIGDLFSCGGITHGDPSDDRFKVRLERHVEGKIGFSAFERVSQ